MIYLQESRISSLVEAGGQGEVEKNVWERRREAMENVAPCLIAPQPGYAQPRPALPKLSGKPVVPSSGVKCREHLQWKVTLHQNHSLFIYRYKETWFHLYWLKIAK